MKAWRPEVGSTRRSTKPRELSVTGSTAIGRCPGATGHIANRSPLRRPVAAVEVTEK
jgi:hypothetical protein